MRAAEADRQTPRGGTYFDIAQVIVRVIQQQKDFVVAVKVAAGQALGANPDA